MKKTLILLYILASLVPAAISRAEEPSDSTGLMNLPPVERDSSVIFFSREPKDTVVSYSFYDSLRTRFFVGAMELTGRAAHSFNHDPTGLLKFVPSQTVIDYQHTPMRRTVSPFGLPGNRDNVVLDHSVLKPLEHVVGPDGKTLSLIHI